MKRLRHVLTDLVCYLIAFLFVYAAVSKLIDHEKFVIQLGQSPMLTLIAPLVAWFIPLIEIIIALLLLWPRARMQGLMASVVLMSAFTVYIFMITRYSEHVPCSCGGVLEKMGWGAHFVFNIVFTGLSVAGVVLHTSTGLPTMNTNDNQQPITAT